MTQPRSEPQLIPIWEANRSRFMHYGHALHALLPEGEPAITFHGRELRPEDEGIGFQFQFLLTDALYDGTVKAACFVVQVQLVPPQRASIGVRIDAVPILETRSGQFDIVGRLDTTIPLGNQRKLKEFFAESLTDTASRFFNRVRAGEPVDAATISATPPQQVPTT